MKRLLILAFAALFAISCMPDNSGVHHTKQNITDNFKRTFYADGKPILVQSEDNAKLWFIAVESSIIPCYLFENITGINIEPTERYEKSYVSNDNTHQLHIRGLLNPTDKIYARLTVILPSCPEIEEIWMVDLTYFEQ